MKDSIKDNIQISFLNKTEALGHKNMKEDDRQSRNCSECLSDTNRLKKSSIPSPHGLIHAYWTE